MTIKQGWNRYPIYKKNEVFLFVADYQLIIVYFRAAYSLFASCLFFVCQLMMAC